MSTTSQIDGLIQITSRLITVLEREVEMLRQSPSTELQALQEEKSALTAAYESQARSLAGHPELLQALQPVLRAELERVTSRFQSAVSVNEAALRAARETTQRVLQAIADELDKNRRNQAGYSATGYGSTASYGGGVQPISIALDEHL
jgi:flagellar biosynthesis/type III secretory pathway chaperone